MKKKKRIIPIAAVVAVILGAVFLFFPDSPTTLPSDYPVETLSTESSSLELIFPKENASRYSEFCSSLPPKYSGKAYDVVNGNTPFFTESDITTVSYEYYAPLDSLGRCTVAYACIGEDLFPTTERGNIGQIKPTGWHTVKYDIVDGKYLYNRCHLIGFQLTGENANAQNLITGTRYLNIEGMLPFENMVADYIKETKNHVLYRVTPIFDGYSLVASGVLMEAFSVEDGGDGILFNVYCHNIQPGVKINYQTGESELE